MAQIIKLIGQLGVVFGVLMIIIGFFLPLFTVKLAVIIGGVFLLLLGLVFKGRGEKAIEAGKLKKCPECAISVNKEARICSSCKYEFAEAA